MQMLILSSKRGWELVAWVVTPGNILTTDPIDTTGADLIVLYSNSWAIVPGGVMDNKGNPPNWEVVNSQTPNGIEYMVAQRNPIVGPGHTFTSYGGQAIMCVAAFSGVSQTLPVVDQISRSASPFPGSITPTSERPLFVTTAANGGGAFTGIDSGFTILGNIGGVPGVTMGGAMAYLLQDGTAPVNPQWAGTLTSSMMVCFNPR